VSRGLKGIVLCAGLGNRLRPLTSRWPKPAVVLLGAPLLRFSLACLKRANINQVGINTHHLPEIMERVARDECQRLGLELHISREAAQLLGTGGGVHGFKDFVKDDDVVVMNGDVLFSIEVAPVVRAHATAKSPATMVLLPMPAGEKYNAVEVDIEGRVRRIANKGLSLDQGALTSWHFSGMHVLSPEVFEFMNKSGPEDINHDVYLRMMASGRFPVAFRPEPEGLYWSDLGTPERYGKTHQDVLFGQVPQDAFGESSVFHQVRFAQNYWAHPKAQLHDVKVAGPAWFAEGCVLEDGVRIGTAVSVGRGAVVGRGARLNRVAVLDGASVSPGLELEDCLVMPGDGGSQVVRWA
jgi:mannose-1-phosphate guanylyltransferase